MRLINGEDQSAIWLFPATKLLPPRSLIQGRGKAFPHLNY